MKKNPFLTYGYDGPEYFCDRVEETKTKLVNYLCFYLKIQNLCLNLQRK